MYIELYLLYGYLHPSYVHFVDLECFDHKEEHIGWNMELGSAIGEDQVKEAKSKQ